MKISYILNIYKMQSNNIFIYAAAGSGKTTELVERALSIKNSRILITTYTNANLRSIIEMIEKKVGSIPENITIKTWFLFLLEDCIRPYQNYLYKINRINRIFYVKGISAKYYNSSDIEKYYFGESGSIYSDKLADFAFKCNKISSNRTIIRLEKCYKYIFIDEAQDLAGYDFDLLELIINSEINIIAVADGRQNTFDTTPSQKNKKYANDILLFFNEMYKRHKGNLLTHDKSHRCNSEICNFACKIFPDKPPFYSSNDYITNHDGIFFITDDQLDLYQTIYKPQILSLKKPMGKYKFLKTMNFGISKGLSFDRVLIIPTQDIIRFLKSFDHKCFADKTRCKFYVAVTRAKYSVVFLTDSKVKNLNIKKFEF